MARANYCVRYFPVGIKGGKAFGIGTAGCYKQRGEAVKRARQMVWKKGLRARRSAWVCDERRGALVRAFGNTEHVRCRFVPLHPGYGG